MKQMIADMEERVKNSELTSFEAANLLMEAFKKE